VIAHRVLILDRQFSGVRATVLPPLHQQQAGYRERSRRRDFLST
jgi:hypothetical protein